MALDKQINTTNPRVTINTTVIIIIVRIIIIWMKEEGRERKREVELIEEWKCGSNRIGRSNKLVKLLTGEYQYSSEEGEGIG